VAQWQSAPPQQVATSIICDECKKPIQPGSRVIEFFEGLSANDIQTGEAIIIDAEDSSGLTHAHWKCFLKHAVANIADEDEDALEPFWEEINELAWSIYETEMAAQEERDEIESRLGHRLEDPNA
jgi:hypothetical protein